LLPLPDRLKKLPMQSFETTVIKYGPDFSCIRQNRSHSDITAKGLAVTNKGRMPYQKKEFKYRIPNNELRTSK
jgi:hypothetical protein